MGPLWRGPQGPGGPNIRASEGPPEGPGGPPGPSEAQNGPKWPKMALRRAFLALFGPEALLGPFWAPNLIRDSMGPSLRKALAGPLRRGPFSTLFSEPPRAVDPRFYGTFELDPLLLDGTLFWPFFGPEFDPRFYGPFPKESPCRTPPEGPSDPPPLGRDFWAPSRLSRFYGP